MIAASRLKIMMLCITVVTLVLASVAAGPAVADDVTWQVVYDADELPAADKWTYEGPDDAATLEDGSLRLVDEGKETVCHYRTDLQPPPDADIVVEARLKVNEVGGESLGRIRPTYHGGPVAIKVGDGSHEEGIVLVPGRLTTFLDRMVMTDTTSDFHVYRLEVSGRNMSVFVDGKKVIEGRDAFWQESAATPFMTFGSTCELYSSDAIWDYIRVGYRPHVERERESELRITMSDPWRISAEELGVPRITRPYLYDVGQGRLMVSVAQGPDAIFEPYGVLTSTDQGRTWRPIEGMQDKTFAPQPMIRMSDGSIFGASRWTVRYTTPSLHRLGTYVGISYRFDPDAKHFEMYESRIHTPEDILAEGNATMVFDRDIFRRADDTLLAVAYNRHAGYLLRSTDRGRTWNYVSTIGERHEPGVDFVGENKMVALLRQSSMRPLHLVRSEDAGETWSEPRVLEFGSVCPDLVQMSNGVLACSYGRPGSCIAFSTDRGKTWSYHRVITPARGFNYTSIREVSPGRLLYMHDAPAISCLHIDVEVIE